MYVEGLIQGSHLTIVAIWLLLEVYSLRGLK